MERFKAIIRLTASGAVNIYEKMKALSFRGKLILTIVLAVVLLLVLVKLFSGETGSGEGSGAATATVQHGEFVISVTESGVIRATRSMTISAPRIGVNLQIIDMVAEGTYVNEGDMIVQFDPSEVMKSIDQKESELAIAKADLDKARANAASTMAQMEASLKDAQANLRLQELQIQKLKYEADIEVERGKLQLEQARINVQQAKEKMKAQEKILKAELETLELRIRQAKAELGKWTDYLDKLALTAPADGLVVYEEHYSRSSGGTEKVKIGDSPYPGEAIVQLPDLSEMEVKVQVNEVDISRIAVNQKAKVNLDAFEEPTYNGKVNDISTLARKKNWWSNVKVFDVTVGLHESDEKLKPGMTAKVEIISDEIPDVAYIPIEAVFEKKGEKVVYVMGGIRPERRVVELGKRNDNFVIVQNGLEEGEAVALKDPFIESDTADAGKTGDEAFKF